MDGKFAAAPVARIREGRERARTYEEDVEAYANAVHTCHGGCMLGVESLLMRNVGVGRAKVVADEVEGV